MGWNYSSTVTDGTPRDASELMILLNEAKAGLETVELDEVNFLSETLSFHMHPSGHTHNGTDAKGVLGATASIAGGLKVHTEAFFIEKGSYGTTAPTAHDFNAASAIDTVVAVVAMWREATLSGNYTHPSAGNAWTNYNQSSHRAGSAPWDMYYWVVDRTAAKHGVYVWNQLELGGTVDPIEFRVWILGL